MARRIGRSSRIRPSTGLMIAFGVLVAIGLTAGPSLAATNTSTGYRLPFRFAEAHKVTQGWGGSTSHTGKNLYAYDFSMPIGTPVLAVARGTVAYAVGKYTACGGSAYINMANYVVLNHSDGTATQYAHLSRVDVSVGQVVAPGQQLGLSGDVGYTSCGPHLHFMRQAQSSTTAFTQSQPIYFEEYPGTQLAEQSSYTSGNPACNQGATTMPTGSFCGLYYKGIFSGAQYMARLEPAINFSWGTSGPGGYWFSSTTDNYSARWVGKFNFAAGPWTFYATGSDGIRVYVDGVALIDSWVDRSGPATLSNSKSLAAGYHVVQVEAYVKGGAATARVSWDTCSGTIC